MIRLCYTNLYLFDRSSFLCLEELEYHLYPHTPTQNKNGQMIEILNTRN